jgi:predicted phage-related endonuclease
MAGLGWRSGDAGIASLPCSSERVMSPRRIQRIKISDRESWLTLRKQDVTASVVGCLFGAHPHQTVFGLAAEKTGVEFPDEDTTAMRRGRLLEGAVAQAFLEENPGWRVKKADVYLRHTQLRLGATPDFFASDPQGRRVTLQAKTIAPNEFRKRWTPETPPLWISLQCLVESMLDNSDLGMVAALIVDGWHFELHTYEVPRHPAAEKRIKAAVEKFWADVAAGREPAVDYERDGPLLDMIFPREVKDKVIDLRGDNMLPELLAQHEDNRAAIKRLKDQQEKIETEVKTKLRDGEAALVDGFKVTWREQHRKEYVVAAKSYRVLRITEQKDKEAAA